MSTCGGAAVPASTRLGGGAVTQAHGRHARQPDVGMVHGLRVVSPVGWSGDAMAVQCQWSRKRRGTGLGCGCSSGPVFAVGGGRGGLERGRRCGGVVCAVRGRWPGNPRFLVGQ